MSSILALHENRAATGAALLNGRRSLEDQGMTSSIPGKIRPGLVRLLASMIACGSTPKLSAIMNSQSPGLTVYSTYSTPPVGAAVASVSGSSVSSGGATTWVGDSVAAGAGRSAGGV